MKKHFKHISSLLLIALVMLMGMNSVFNLHTHIMSDGTVQVHAHPFNKSSDTAPVKNHHHSILEFVVIASLGAFLLSAVLGLALSQMKLLAKIANFYNPSCKVQHLTARYGRAPPVI